MIVSVFIPIIVGLIMLVFPMENKKAGNVAFITTLLTLAAGIYLFATFDMSLKYEHVINDAIKFSLILDGLSLLFVMMIAALFPVAVLLNIGSKSSSFWGNVLITQGAMAGAVLAGDLITFYLFWEIMLIPVFFLIGLFGGEKSKRAAITVMVYTMGGSLLMLLGILFLGYIGFQQTGTWNFELQTLHALQLSGPYASMLFLLFMAAFAIKIPIFPLHGWLPLAYVEGPYLSTFMLSAVMAKVAIYAIIRIVLPVFSAEFVSYGMLFSIPAVFGMIYFGIIAISQGELKKILAYSSASHMAIIALGAFTGNVVGLTGSLYLSAAHATATGLLFLLAGLLHDKCGNDEMNNLRGLAKTAPIFSAVFAVAMFSSLGLPGTNGFIGELLVILGVFKNSIPLGIFTTLTLIVGVLYMLKAYQKLFFGETTATNFVDLNLRETIAVIPIVIIIILTGVYTKPIIDKIKPITEKQSNIIQTAKGGSK